MTSDTHSDSTVPPADERAVAEILGSILLFGLVVLLIALIQLNAVPAANQQVEFEHNQRVQGDMQEFQEVLSRTSATGVGGTVKIEAGTGYPNRFFLFNPPRTTGRVELSNAGEIRLSNVQTSGEVGGYLNGTNRSFTTSSLVYTPNYNEYRNAPSTVYENGVLYNRYDNNQSVVQSRGALISGRRISLLALQGNLSTAASYSIPLDATPVSGPAQSVSVTDASSNITLRVPTRLTVEEWEEILSDERPWNGGHVSKIRAGPGRTVILELQRGVTYDLRTAAVGLGSNFDRSTAPQYIVTAAGNDTTVPEGETHRLVAEVRDRYNNPVSNVTVNANASLGDVSVVGTGRSDSDGEVKFTYEAPASAPSNLAPVTVTAHFNSSVRRGHREANFTLAIEDTDDSTGTTGPGGGGNPINPSDGQAVALVGSDLLEPGGGNSCSTRQQDCVADITLENLDTTSGRTIEEVRVGFYSESATGTADTYTVADAPSGMPSSSRTVGGGYQGGLSLDDLSANDGATGGSDEQVYRVAFQFSSVPGGGNGVVEGDFFIFEVIFSDDDGDQSVATYFVGPTTP